MKLEFEDQDSNWTPGKKSRSGRTIKTPPSRNAPAPGGRGRGRGRPPGSKTKQRVIPDSYTPDLDTKYDLKLDNEALDSTSYVRKEAKADIVDDEPCIVIYGPANSCSGKQFIFLLSWIENSFLLFRCIKDRLVNRFEKIEISPIGDS